MLTELKNRALVAVGCALGLLILGCQAPGGGGAFNIGSATTDQASAPACSVPGTCTSTGTQLGVGSITTLTSPLVKGSVINFEAAVFNSAAITCSFKVNGVAISTGVTFDSSDSHCKLAYTPAVAGVITVALTVADTSGASAIAPQATFTVNDNAGQGNGNVYFADCQATQDGMHAWLFMFYNGTGGVDDPAALPVKTCWWGAPAINTGGNGLPQTTFEFTVPAGMKPIAELAADNWSVRFSEWVPLLGGNYTYTVTSHDGSYFNMKSVFDGSTTLTLDVDYATPHAAVTKTVSKNNIPVMDGSVDAQGKVHKYEYSFKLKQYTNGAFFQFSGVKN